MANGVLPFEKYNVIVDNTSLSGSNYEVTKTYTVSGSGIIIAFASTRCTANDWGLYSTEIKLNDTVVGRQGIRYNVSGTQGFGSCACAPMVVTNGDQIQIWVRNSKDGAKSIYRRFLCIGECTLS